MPSETGKTDMDRIGLFSEMEYITIGDKYISPFSRPFNEAAGKNKQMLPGGIKEKGATQAGYFDPQFSRIFEGESYSNPVQLRRRYRLAEAKKNLGARPFLPSNGDKFPCGVGTYYGTISGPCTYFSAQLKDKIAYVQPGKNLYTSPGKKGTGYGYPNLTIGKPYTHSVELYDTGRINFKPGGMKAGTFDPFPIHSTDPYGIRMPRASTTNKQGNVFHPNPGTKSRPVRSIMALNIEKSLNVTNYTNPRVMSY
ncbi:UPF0602 protein C4orf47 homolog isoform X2 [Crotalus tigris]|uniref:UPF0602 protein C4orf47 homolog isoform X2 n=1 Tax=Crotalus tigris TaxID=88082 RepID=UPI00192F129F|nr:UPF0602 protein C4orf47 homolog isoform X2 [Crotalus tigris]